MILWVWRDFASIDTDWSDIIYGAWHQDLLTVHFSDKSLWWVSYNPPFFSREKCNYKNIYFIICLFYQFVSYTLFLIFALCHFCVPVEHGFLNFFALLSKYKLLSPEHFLFYFNVFPFLFDYQFWFSLSWLLLWLFSLLILLLLYYYLCH